MAVKSEQSADTVHRREFLTWTGAALAGATLGAIPLVASNRVEAADAAAGGRKRTLRLAHMTDMHVQPELSAGEGMAAALKHVQSIPDPPELIFTGGRNNEFDIYRIPADGSGPEVNLTNTKGLDDGPEYTPDGKYIYFNSARTGSMQIWRMKPDGRDQEQVTSDEYNNWFPHISPDGKWIAFLSFPADVAAGDHPFYKQVYLRLMPINGGPARVIAYLYGGQGTINVPSWSPDSKRLAFVSNTKMEGRSRPAGDN